ncbi:hypothetical protein BDP27DRAFT_1371260 [Rhodocollybia butyracea]|uniref:PHD-type domain-containing protein n=1 Tax=Rhodocollybia butyracea TaxID=206335 RepID=A0A9P5PBD6_9AGAR|nr:hypothetical protein BDP27DRAFT_1371260 [Rhodocollybia butyracea]
MSPRTTRSTRSSKQTASTSPAPASKNTPKSSKPSSKSQDVESQAGKENKNVQETDTDMTVDTKGKNPVIDSQIASSTTTVSDQLFCTCKKGDDGTPMIHCAECKDWFHFSCINLDETDAEDISVFVCPACSEKTSLHSLMSWEEADPVEEARPKKSGPLPIAPKPRKKSKTPKDSIPTEKAAAPELEPLSSSEDSEDDDYVIEARAKGGRGTRRFVEPLIHSESDLSDLSDEPTTRLRKASSPTLKRIAKRALRVPRRRKPRPQIHWKILRGDIVLGSWRIKSEDSGSAAQVMEKRKEDLTEEERTAVLEDSKQFADDLEKCVFEIYSEPDKHGKLCGRSKVQRVASGLITPKEISLMSSTDLANEELKQSIKSAEQESLEQSILTKTTAPRTKITHKAKVGRTSSVPAHAFDTSKESLPIRPSLITTLHLKPVATEPELNLADLINIDDEPGWGQEDCVPDYHQFASESTGPAIVRSPNRELRPLLPRPAPAPEVVASPSALNPRFSSATAQPTTLNYSNPEASIPKDKAMEGESVTPNDQDFDMFLEEKESETLKRRRLHFEPLPKYGLERSTCLLTFRPSETLVIVARWAADILSCLWAMENAVFLRYPQNRRTCSRTKLGQVLVADVPDADDSGFKSLSEFLINKGGMDSCFLGVIGRKTIIQEKSYISYALVQ